MTTETKRERGGGDSQRERGGEGERELQPERGANHTDERGHERERAGHKSQRERARGSERERERGVTVTSEEE